MSRVINIYKSLEAIKSIGELVYYNDYSKGSDLSVVIMTRFQFSMPRYLVYLRHTIRPIKKMVRKLSQTTRGCEKF